MVGVVARFGARDCKARSSPSCRLLVDLGPGSRFNFSRAPLVFQLLHPYSNFFELFIIRHYSYIAVIVWNQLELRNPQSHVIPKSMTHNNRGSGN